MSELKFKAKFGKPRPRQTNQKPVPGFVATEEIPTPPPVTSATQPRRVSRAARLLALAYYVERQIEEGSIKDYAEAARLLGMSRARMSQVMGLLLLPLAAQNGILRAERDVSERSLRTGGSRSSTSKEVL